MDIQTKVEVMKQDFSRRQSVEGLVKDQENIKQLLGAEYPNTMRDMTPRETKINMDSPSWASIANHDNKRRSTLAKKAKISPGVGTSSNETEINFKDITLDMKKTCSSISIKDIEKTLKTTKKPPIKMNGLSKKSVILTVFLFIVGLVALIVGAVYHVGSRNPHKSIPFWVIGGVCILPGIFFGYRLIIFCFARDENSRRRALEAVPQD